MGDISKILITTGVIFVLAGGLLVLAEKIPGIGKLPGDIFIKKENVTFYFPLTTCLLVSLLLSLLFMFWGRR